MNTMSASSRKYEVDPSGYEESDEVPITTTQANEIRKPTVSTTSAEPSSASSSHEETTTPSTTLTSTYGSTIPADSLPVVPPFKPNLPPEHVPGYLMLFLKSSFADVCQPSSALRENLFQYITRRSIRYGRRKDICEESRSKEELFTRFSFTL